MLTLICAQENDIHSEYVQRAVNELGGQALIFERYNTDQNLSFSFKPGLSDAWLTINNKKYSLIKDINSILWRVKPHLQSEIPGAESSVGDKFRYHEWKHTISSMEDFLPNKKCVNDLSSMTKMNRKVVQLKNAVECGLLIPHTVISNSAFDISNCLEFKNLIYKTTSSFLTDEKLIYTNKVDRDELMASADDISLAPGIFQELIEKEYEIRVVVIKDEIFACKVDSQKFTSTKLDWRYTQHEQMFSELKLSEGTSKKLIKFHNKSGLIFATYDFIVDKNGNEIFLECNPCGQWLFVGDKLGLPITLSLARQLLL